MCVNRCTKYTIIYSEYTFINYTLVESNQLFNTSTLYFSQNIDSGSHRTKRLLIHPKFNSQEPQHNHLLQDNHPLREDLALPGFESFERQ